MGTLRDIAVPANHFLASYDPNGPLRVLYIPGNLHSFCSHDILQPCWHYSAADHYELVKAFSSGACKLRR